ncbi:hypothetical protein HK104_007256 [Borealophlyctis nickersoniae]|nr:hypothetical protein HK104_007256 [Borealophlyctis nickersoniae]
MSAKVPRRKLEDRGRAAKHAGSNAPYKDFLEDTLSDSDQEWETESDSASSDGRGGKVWKLPKTSKEDLLYDPTADEEDMKWVKTKKGTAEGTVLTCPCCFTVLCYDCQRHAKYPNQWRAMFVQNCHVVMEEAVHYGDSKGKKQEQLTAPSMDRDSYHPVRCDICETDVAVYDVEEVYHFFHVLAS